MKALRQQICSELLSVPPLDLEQAILDLPVNILALGRHVASLLRKLPGIDNVNRSSVVIVNDDVRGQRRGGNLLRKVDKPDTSLRCHTQEEQLSFASRGDGTLRSDHLPGDQRLTDEMNQA